MQAILTRYLPATNVRGSRIKASCERGSITVPYQYQLGPGEAVHRFAVDALISKFNKEDAKQYGPEAVIPGRCWNAPYSSGGLPNGDWAHTFIHENCRTVDVLRTIYANAAESPEWIRAKIESLPHFNA